MAYITTSDVEAYLGTTFDSAETAVYSDIIDAVCKYIECYTGQCFTDDVYTERVSIIDGMFNLNNNIQHIYGAFYGRKAVIEATAPNAYSSIDVDIANEQIKVLADLGTTSTISVATNDLAELSTSIAGVAGYTSSLKDNVNSDYFALTIYTGQYRANPDDSNKITLYAANEPMDVARVRGKVYSTCVACEEGVVVYQGGYVAIPDDLKDATIRFVIKAYNDRNVTSASGTLKSEKIGDYSYTNFTASEESAGLGTLAIDYYSVLDCYRTNFDI